jgi:hypothetical protein
MSDKVIEVGAGSRDNKPAILLRCAGHQQPLRLQGQDELAALGRAIHDFQESCAFQTKESK